MREIIETLVLTAVIFLGVRVLVQNYKVEGYSMEPTLDDGQYLLINKATYFHVEGTPLDRVLPVTHQGSADFLFGGPQRGDRVEVEVAETGSVNLHDRLALAADPVPELDAADLDRPLHHARRLAGGRVLHGVRHSRKIASWLSVFSSA